MITHSFTSSKRFDPVLCVMVDQDNDLPPYRGADPANYVRTLQSRFNLETSRPDEEGE